MTANINLEIKKIHLWERRLAAMNHNRGEAPLLQVYFSNFFVYVRGHRPLLQKLPSRDKLRS